MRIHNTLWLCLLLAFTVFANDTTKSVEDHFVAGEALFIQIAADSSSLFNGAFPVSRDGFADFPILGKVYVLDQTPTQLATFIAEKGSTYMKDTHVKAIPAVRMTFLGNWKRQGMFFVNPQGTFWDAVLYTQGPLNEKNIHKLKVQRGHEKLAIDVLDVYSKGTTLVDAGIQTGDIVILPTPGQGFWFYFKDVVMVTASITTAVAGIISTYLLIDRL